jgi:hypothetical protein
MKWDAKFMKQDQKFAGYFLKIKLMHQNLKNAHFSQKGASFNAGLAVLI